MTTRYSTRRGSSRCLGPRFARRRGASGINFAVFSTAEAVDLEVFRAITDNDPVRVIGMKRTRDPTDSGWIYHRFLAGADNRTLYNFNVGGQRLLDPYARALAGKPDWDAEGVVSVPRCVAYRSNFDWQGDQSPNIALGDSIIYEVLVSGFTGHSSSRCNGKHGTFAGMIKKIPHLKELGITTVELMPIFEFDPWDCLFSDPTTGEPLTNIWGYNTLGFFAPDGDLAYWKLGSQIDELKLLVRELHKAGIEVILDVVLNHTREGNEQGPVMSFKGLANEVYYLLNPDGSYDDWTGVGNTLNTNHPVVRRFILDCLRYWVEEFHIDGFRFDLAAIFAVDTDHHEQRGPTAIIQEIEADPVLSRIKLIAEPWSPRGHLLHDGPFTRERWARWNDDVRDTLRRWVRGDFHQARALQIAIQDSTGDIVFTDCHDGFTLLDLVCFEYKHNWSNGENNRDGSDNNHSANGGFEGCSLVHSGLPEVEQESIWRLRFQQVRNLLSLLFLCRGTPMVLFGDEFGRSAEGNNNAVFQQSLNLLDWNLEKKHGHIFRFMQGMIALRKRHRIHGRPITWHGLTPNAPDLGGHARFVAWTLEPLGNFQGRIYVASNTHTEPLTAELPPTGDGRRWHRLVDTSLAADEAILADEAAVLIDGGSYRINGRSTIILLAK